METSRCEPGRFRARARRGRSPYPARRIRRAHESRRRRLGPPRGRFAVAPRRRRARRATLAAAQDAAAAQAGPSSRPQARTLHSLVRGAHPGRDLGIGGRDGLAHAAGLRVARLDGADARSPLPGLPGAERRIPVAGAVPSADRGDGSGAVQAGPVHHQKLHHGAQGRRRRRAKGTDAPTKAADDSPAVDDEAMDPEITGSDDEASNGPDLPDIQPQEASRFLTADTPGRAGGTEGSLRLGLALGARGRSRRAEERDRGGQRSFRDALRERRRRLGPGDSASPRLAAEFWAGSSWRPRVTAHGRWLPRRRAPPRRRRRSARTWHRQHRDPRGIRRGPGWRGSRADGTGRRWTKASLTNSWSRATRA